MGDLRKTPLGKLLLLQALIGGGSPAVERIALGNPLTFGTDLARPLVSLEIPFTPQQEGSGDPSPSNIRSIVPWDGLSVVQNSENQLKILNITSNTFKQGIQFDVMKDSSNKVRAFHIYGQADNNNVFQNLNYVSLETLSFEAGEYEVGGFGIGDGIALRVYSRDANNADVLLYNSEIGNTAFTVPSDYKSCWMRIQITTQDDVDGILYPVVVKKGDRITETDIVFPSAVYGGTLDVVSGALTVEFGYVGMKWGDFGNKSVLGDNTRGTVNISSKPSTVGGAEAICNIAKRKWNYTSDDIHFYADGNFVMAFLPNDTDDNTEIQIAYPLATPQEIQLTPQQITAIIGNNTIWSDADGSLTAVYLVSSKYADEHPVGGLGFGFGSGSSDPDEPDDPENPDESEEPIIDDSENNQIEGEEP